MKSNKTTVIADIIIYLLNDLLGWFIMIMFDSTGNDAKFQNLTTHRLFLAIGIFHIIVSILCSLFFYRKERTRHHIRIGNKLFIYNMIMTLVPYLYLVVVWVIV